MGAARQAWDDAKHPRGPNGRFIKAGSGATARPSLAEAVRGTAARGPKRQSSARDRMRPSAPTAARSSGHMMDRYNTTEQQYVEHFNGVTDAQLHASARNSGVRTEGRPREAIVRDLAAIRAREDRQALEVNAQANAAKAENSKRLTSPEAPTRAAKPKTARGAFDSARAAGVGGQLTSATSRADAERALSGLTMAQLRQVAASHGVTLRSKTTKANAITAIVASVVGRRLDSQALSRL